MHDQEYEHAKIKLEHCYELIYASGYPFDLPVGWYMHLYGGAIYPVSKETADALILHGFATFAYGGPLGSCYRSALYERRLT